MSRDISRKSFYNRGRNWNGNEYRSHQMSRKRSRSPTNRDSKRRSRSPRKSDKELMADNILTEILKLPESNELWDNQFQEGGGFSRNGAPPPSSSFTQEGAAYPSNYQPSYTGGYDDFSVSIPPGTHQSNVSGWNQVPVSGAPASQVFVHNVEDQIKKEAAIESEMRHQKAALSKQREDCIKKATNLRKELESLKDQRNGLHNDHKRSPSPDTKRFLKENTKLQLEIQNKLKTINNVVDMLNGIIGEEAQEKNEGEGSTERSSKRKSRSPSSKKFNYVYYDPEMHWCRVCNEFPSTAKDYLMHLHTAAHHKMASAHMEAPWHTMTGVNEGFPNYPSAPTKRTPIRGLQFFVPSTAWYCKLCDQFIGDLHCASAHLKSIVHSKNYTNFVEQNPHWDTDWMSDRQKAFEKIRGKVKVEDKPQYTAHTITFSKDGFHTKRNNSPTASNTEKKRKKDRKKKKSKKKKSSSSDTNSSSSSSDCETKSKKKKEKTLSEWISLIPMNYNERKLLDNLKNRAQESVHQKSRPREERDRREERRVDERREERREERQERREERPERRDDRPERRDERADRRDARRDNRSAEQSGETKKPEIKKMPFIGKMPVFKNLGKNIKNEDQKKDDEKKKQEEEQVNKKRREEMDAEIQKKVAQFKEKIAKAQFEKQQQGLGTSLALSAQLSFLPPSTLINPAIPPPPTPNNLPKDFQDALDIIFPSNANQSERSQQELFMPGLPGFPCRSIPGVVPPFAHLGLPPMMMGFDLNQQLFPHRPQLYDTHVPIVPNNQRNNTNDTIKMDELSPKASPKPSEVKIEKLEIKEKNKEELDELAMLGIDATDVGAGM